MNRRKFKKLVTKVERGVKLIEKHLANTLEEGSLVLYVANDCNVGDVKNLLHCTKTEAYMIKQVCKASGVMIERSWDGSIYDFVLLPRVSRVFSLWGKKEYPKGYLNLNLGGSTDPNDWEEVVLSMSVKDGGYRNYKDSVDLV